MRVYLLGLLDYYYSVSKSAWVIMPGFDMAIIKYPSTCMVAPTIVMTASTVLSLAWIWVTVTKSTTTKKVMAKRKHQSTAYKGCITVGPKSNEEAIILEQYFHIPIFSMLIGREMVTGVGVTGY